MQNATMPALNGTGQLYSQCAYLWAVPGATLYLPPFGVLNISGVNGDLITFQNMSIIPGTVIAAGTILILGAPQAATSSQLQTSLDKLGGFLNNAASHIVGTPNQLLRWNSVGSTVQLQSVSGMIFLPNPSFATEITPKDSGGAGISTTPIPSAGTGLSAFYDLPNLPASNMLPAQFWVKVHIRLSAVTAETTEANSFKALQSSIELAALNSAYSTHVEVLLPVTSNRLQLEFTKVNARANCYARVRVIGYYF
jgi:hypothetical protein